MMQLLRPEVVASASGGLLEMYDFTIYTFMDLSSPPVFSQEMIRALPSS